MPKAPAPSRQTDSLTLSLGLLLLPLATYSATEKGGITRATFRTGTEHRVGVQKYDKETGEVLANDQCDMRIDTQYGHVFVEDHDIEALFTLEPQTMKVLEFQPRHLWDQGHYVPERLMYVGPGKTQQGSKKKLLPATLRAYATLMQAMEERNAMALVEITTRGKPKPALLFPDGRLFLVHYTEEVREQPEFDLPETIPGEVAMAGGLVDALFSTEPKDLADERTALILAHAEEKARKGDFTKTEDTTTVEDKPAPDADAFMAMLQASIDAAKAQKAAS